MNILEALQAQSGETGETFIDVNPNGPTAVPGGDDLLLSEFAHLGTDLQITLPSGDEIVIVDYFAGDGTPPALVTEGGAVMNGDLVNQLAGPMVPDTQVAQSGTSDALGEPAGTIDSMTGVVTATRGGVEVELNAGDAIYEGDVLNTADGSAVGIIFSDDSTMSMGANARISIDEMVFDAEAGQGSQLFDIVQGAFVFASGQIGHNNPEDVQVRTPVATIGIRGTKYAVDVDQELGDATVTLFEGAVVVENSAGQVLLNSIGQSTRIGSAFESPGDVFVMDPDTQTETYGDAIDYHPNAPQLREDDDGGGDDGPVDGDDLSAEELEELAEQLDDLDTAAGPSGAIAGFSQSALFLRLLNGVLEGNDITSGELAGEDGAFGTQLPFLDLINKSIDSPLGQIGGDDGFVFDRSFGAGDFGPGGGTVTFTFGSASNVSVTGGSSALDVFSIDVTGSSSGTTWTVGQNASGNVVISESGGTNINMDEVEELAIDLGGSSDTVTIGNLGNTDIAQSTVSIDGGDGDDIINAALAGKRLVAEGGDGDDQILGGTSNDNLFGNDGADTLAGGTGNDLLVGGDGDDTILVQANGTGINEFTGYQDEIAKLNDLIADLDQETDSEEIATLQQKIEDLSREVDIVQGGDGNDTLTLSFSPGLLLQPGVVDDLIALKSFVDNGGEGTQTFEALGLQVSGIETLNFVNLPTPDASASLTIGEAVEDGTVDVSLTLGGDQGGLFSTSVTISGVPTGATLVAADGTEYAGGGDIELSGDAVGDFSIVLAPDSDEDFQLSVAVSAENVLDGGTATGSVVGTVAVDGVADAPVVSVVNAAGDEDSQISLSIDVSQGDADGSEQLSVAIEGLPVGAILSDANGNLIDPADVPVDALQGLQLLAPLNFSGTLNLTVVATSTEGGTSETTSQSFTVDVAGVADIVETVVEDVVGTEDSLIPLSIDVDLTDADEALTISIEGLPEGASLVDAAGNAVDAANIPVEALDGLQLSVADNFSGDISLTVNATNADGESTSLTSQGFTVSITPVADNPVLTLGDGSGNEDGSIDLNLDVGLTDLDGSETLTVSITGLPAGAVLKDADGNVVDPTDVPAGALGNLSLLPPQDFSGDINLTVTATSTDGDSTAIQTGGLTVSVAGVADAPIITVSDASGDEDNAIGLSINISQGDIDGSETLSVAIEGLPEGAVLKDADGNVVDPSNVPTSLLSGLSLLPPLNFSGQLELTVVATSTENGTTETSTETITVDVAGVADLVDAVIEDVVGSEDSLVPLSIDVDLTDADETLTISIDGIPDHATLVDAEGNPVDPANVPVDALDGLQLSVTDNFSGDIPLTVTMTTTDGQSESVQTADLTVSVTGVADAPTLTVEGASGQEGVPLSLNISSALTDTDGSETLTVSISGLPDGAVLKDADGNVVDPANVPTSALNALTLLPALGTIGSFALTVTATATEADGDSASVTETLNLNIGEVAAAPVLSVLDAVGNEDGSIALSISATPGQEGDTVTITIDNLPAGATLTNDEGETFEGGASITLTPDQLAGLTVHPAPNSDADLNLTVTATASDGGATAEVSSGLSVTIDAVADTPTLTVSNLTGSEGVPLSLNISAELMDSDGSETLSIEISGLPEGFSITDGQNTYSGDPVSIPASAISSLTLLPVVGVTGALALTVTATATEADGGDSASISQTIGINLSEVAAAPVLSVLDAVGNEDGSIALSISAAPGQVGDTVTVTIDNLPAGATLTNADGETFEGGSSITLTTDQLNGLTVHPAPDSDADLSLTVTATAVDGQAVETTSSGLTVTVDAVADVPTLTVSDVTGAFGRSGVDILTGTSGDDTLIGGAGGDTLLGGDGNDTLIGDGDLLPATVSLDITSALEDIDGSESLSVTISGIPEGVQLLQDGVVLVTGGSVDLTGLLDSLTLIVPPGTPDFDLTVTATATESSNQDTASAEATISVTLDDGSELGLDDVLDGGAGDDVILGGAGNDTISSGEGADTIDGGAGNDVISVIQEGAGDIIDGGEGTDTLTLTVTDWDLLDVGIVADVLALVEFVASGAAATGSKVFNSLGIEVRNIEAVNIVDINGDPIDPDNLEGITFTGGDGDDIASGTQFDDKMSGGDGDDTLSGLGGDDDLKGGDGNDVLLGGAGDDKLKGEDGNDTLDGGDGDDELKGGDGNDILQGGAGDDKLKGEDGNDTLDGGDGDDELKGGDGNDILQGGAGDDELKGEDGDDVLDGGAGTDTLVGGKGDDTLDGGDGDDTVWGGTGDDVISGGAGDDTLDGGDGDDTIYGGAGDDTITGGSGDDVIHSDGGNDVIFADDGDDVTIVTIDSADTDRDISLNGGDGDDTLRISLSEDHPGLDAVMAEINAATLAAQQNPGAVQSIESLGITFQNYEDIEIYVGGEQVSYDPTVSGQGDVSTDTAAMETGVLVLTDLDVQDIDGDVLMQATVEISGGFAEGDKLTVDEDLLSDLGITLESAEATEDGFALVLSGDASIEDYEAALASVRLSSDTGAPDVGTRTIGVTVTDDDGNEADPIFVSVDVGVGEESDLADVGGTGQDSVAFISETDEVGTTVDSVSDIVATTTETLSVSVGKNGNGNTGEFEVIVNGQSMGTFTTTSKATGSNGAFETIEIGEISLPQGAEASIEVRAVSSNSGVLLQGITYGSVAIDAESGDTSSIGGIFDEVINGISTGQSFSDIWSGLSDNFSNLFSDSYVFLDPDGDSSSYTLTPGEGDGSTSDWQQTDGDTTTTPDTSDLGERYDSIDMGGGTDWAVASAGTENDLNVDLSDDAWAGTENVLGGKGDDTLRGNEDANLIAGGDGNDVLIADGGNDLLVGGAGDDEGHFDISDLKQAGSNTEGQSFGTLDQAISDAYAANDTDGAEALENIRAGFDGGSGTDTLKLSGGSAEGTDLSSDEIVDAVSNIEILDVTGVQGPVDMSLSVDDLIEMTDDNDELKIMKDGDDTVNIGGQEYGVGEHTFNVDGVDFKVVIEETPPEGG